jgi:hypothetical protein
MRQASIKLRGACPASAPPSLARVIHSTTNNSTP